jgi:MFS family permease
MLTATINLYKNAYSGLTRRMWLLATVMLINRCGTMVLPWMTLYCLHKGYTEVQGGIAVAIYGLGAMAGALIGGKLSDKYGFYNMQLAALFGGGVMFIVLGQMPTYPTICICIFFASMVNESFRPANASAIAHYSTDKNRTQSFSLVRLAINMGWGVGAAIAGMLAAISYSLLFWVDGISNILAAVTLLLLLPRVSISQQKNTSIVKAPVVISPYKDKIFLKFIFFMLLFAFCFFQLFTTVPVYFKEGLKMNESSIGIIMALNGIIIAVFEMIIVFKIEGRRTYLALMTYGTIMMAISFLFLNLPLVSGIAVALIATIAITIAEITAMPFMNSYYISRTVPENRGSYAGLYTLTWSMAQVIGSLTGSKIAHTYGHHVLWWVIGGICFVAAAGFKWLGSKQ